MSVQLESAYYGNEKSFTNITKSLATKIIGGVLDVTSGSDLKPVFEVAPDTSLNSEDEKRIREEAVKACGGEADQGCLERTRLKLSEERLKEKENENLAANVIKGDRLTVNIVENGRRKTLVAPAGQKLRLENLAGVGKPGDPVTLPTLDQVQTQAIALLTITASTFFWVFGILVGYAVFMRQYERTGRDLFRMVAYATAALSVLFPGAGYLVVLGYFGFTKFIDKYIATE